MDALDPRSALPWPSAESAAVPELALDDSAAADWAIADSALRRARSYLDVRGRLRLLRERPGSRSGSKSGERIMPIARACSNSSDEPAMSMIMIMIMSIAHICAEEQRERGTGRETIKTHITAQVKCPGMGVRVGTGRLQRAKGVKRKPSGNEGAQAHKMLVMYWTEG